MDSAEFDRLVTIEKLRQKSLAVVYESFDSDQHKGHYLRNLITVSSTSRSTWDALNRMAQDYLRQRLTLPEELADWAADALDGVVTTPAKHPRPPRSDKDAARKKVEIFLGVYHLVKLYDLTPTRGLNGLPESCAKGGTACDVIGATLDFSYKAVEKIWNGRDPLLRSY